MNLLDALLAAARQGRSLDLPDAPAAVPAPVDPEYAAYAAEVEAANAKRASCKRCGGLGYFPEYAHRNGGACFRCNGEAVRPEPVKSYREWLACRAEALGLDGFDVMVQD